MSQAKNANRGHLTIVRGGKVTEKDFSHLPFPEKMALLRSLPARKRLTLLEGDPEAKDITRSFAPQELYGMVKEVGEGDVPYLLALCSPRQLVFCLDLEIWDKWTLSTEKALRWLGYLLEEGEQAVVELLPQMDRELLILILMNEITVGGGTGDVISDEERLADWDHTFDNLYYITFKTPRHAKLIGAFLDIIFRNDHPLYLDLMEGVKYELPSELEEQCYQLKAGRLADYGFPERDQALSIYAYCDPATFVPEGEKHLPVAQGDEYAALPLVRGESLFQRILDRTETDDLSLELNYLVNTALVADEVDLSDTEAVENLFLRVYGHVNVALEFLSGGDEARASWIVTHEYLQNLFRLGYSIVVRLKRRAEKLSSDSYAVNKALLGLKALRPRFYRGLDPDGIDGYREFQTVEDIRKTEDFLRLLER